MGLDDLEQIHALFMRLPENSRTVTIALAYFDAFANSLAGATDSITNEEQLEKVLSMYRQMHEKYVQKIRYQPSRT